MGQRDIAQERGAFFSMLVVASFSAWLACFTIFGRSNFAFVFAWGSPFVWFGWLSALLIALGRFWGRHTGQAPCLELLLPLFMLSSGAWQGWMLQRSRAYPSVDELLFTFDRNYGSLAFMVGRWFHQSPILHLAGKWVYLSSILPLAVVYLALPPDIKIRRRLWTSFAVMGLSGVVFYQVCPAAGPIYRFPESFPRYIPLLSAPQARILPHAFLNAMPSLHMALAVLTLMYARHCAKRFQVGAGIFLVLTMLSTLGLGEHYFIDLIVAVPFIVAIDKLPDVVRDRGQRVRVYGCLNAVLFWEIALRQGWALQLSTPIVWVLSIGTVIVPFVPIRSLAKEEDGCGERADVSAISSCALSGASGPSG